MLHIIFYTFQSLLAKNVPNLAKLGEGPDNPIAAPSAILSTSRGFRRNLAPPFRPFRFTLRRVLPIVIDTNVETLTELVFVSVPLNTFLPWYLYDVLNPPTS